MLIFRFIILFCVTTTTVLHALMLKNTYVFSYCPVSPLCLKGSVLAPVSLSAPIRNTQSVLIGQLAHAWASATNNNRAAVLNQFLHSKLAARHTLCKCLTWWHTAMSTRRGVRDSTADEAFQERCSLWERGASVGEDLFHAQQPI